MTVEKAIEYLEANPDADFEMVTSCHDCASCTDETRNQETVHCKAFSAFMDRNDFCSSGDPVK